MRAKAEEAEKLALDLRGIARLPGASLCTRIVGWRTPINSKLAACQKRLVLAWQFHKQDAVSRSDVAGAFCRAQIWRRTVMPSKNVTQLI